MSSSSSLLSWICAPWGLPRRGIDPAGIRLMSGFRRVSVLQPQTHVDFVVVCATDEHMASAAALVHEAERFVQAACPPVRAEDGEFGLLEASSPHPLQDSFHEHAPQADPAPSVPDRNSDPTHTTGPAARNSLPAPRP